MKVISLITITCYIIIMYLSAVFIHLLKHIIISMLYSVMYVNAVLSNFFVLQLN